MSPDGARDPADPTPYETGLRGEAGRAAFVLRPRDTAEAARLIARAVRDGVHLVPQGANTGLVGGSVPDASGLQAVISTDRLRGRVVVDPVERTATAPAGMRLSEVNVAAEPHGLHLPVDLGADPSIGGMVATNTGGARFLRHGDMRRRVLGLTVVLPDADGTVLTSSNLRKDNSGLDWTHLFVGTGGAFGLVTEAVLELAPLPRRTAAALLVPRDGGAVPGLLTALERAFGDTLTAFEMMSGPAIAAALDHVPSLRDPFRGARPALTLLVEVAETGPPHAGAASLDATVQAVLASIWEDGPDLLEDALFGPPAQLWALRHAVSEGVRHAGRLVAFDLGFRRGAVMTFREAVRAPLAAFDPALAILDFGHVGDGGLHLNLVLPRRADRPPDWEARLRDLVVGLARAHGGSFSAEHGLGRTNQRFHDAHAAPQAMRMAAGVVAALDLSPMGALRLTPPPETTP